MGYNLELKMNYINGITPPALKERSPSLGSDTLHFNSVHQSQVSLVNPTHKASVHACARVCTPLSIFSFLFPFLFPRRLMNKILYFLNIYNDREINYPSVRKRVT